MGERKDTPSSVILRMSPRAKDLEATGIRQNRPLPLHEIMKGPLYTRLRAVRHHHFRTWPQHEVEGITENHLSPDTFNITGQHALHRTARSQPA